MRFCTGTVGMPLAKYSKSMIMRRCTDNGIAFPRISLSPRRLRDD
jgi:hypothetical protein